MILEDWPAESRDNNDMMGLEMITKRRIIRMRSSITTATVVATIIFHFLVATASPAPQGIPLPVMIRMMANGHDHEGVECDVDANE